jgi:predicted DNA-binding ribbon-helix-helix protein
VGPPAGHDRPALNPRIPDLSAYLMRTGSGVTEFFMDSSIRKRSVTIAGHSTSVSLEAAFWDALKDIATVRGVSINALIETIDEGRSGNLSSAIRVFVLAEAMKMGASKAE